MRAARLLAVERGVRHGLRDIQQVAKLYGEQPVGVPGAGTIVDPEVAVACLEFVDLLAGGEHVRAQPVDAAAVLHALCHLGAQHRSAFGAAAAGHDRKGALARGLCLLVQGVGIAVGDGLREPCGFDAGHLPEYDEFGERVGAEAIRPVDAYARAFADRIEAGQWRSCRAIGEDPAHCVVHRRQHRDRRVRRVDAEERLGQFVDLRQSLAQLLLAEVPQVEMHHCAMRTVDRAALLLLVPEGLAQPVARPEFHRLVARRRLGGPQAIVLQVAVAVLVHEEPALAAAGFGEEEPRARHAGRVVLDELHVAQRHAMAIGERHAVAGDDAAVGVLAEYASRAAGGDDHGLGLDQGEVPGGDVDRHDALRPAILHDEVYAEVFVESLDRRVFDRGLEQGVQHVEAGLVGGKPGALDLHAPEGAHIGVPVVLAAPRAAPVLHLHHFLVGMRDEVLHHVLLAQPVAAAHGVVEVVLEAVVRPRHGGRAAFGRDRVAAHRVDLGDQRHHEGGIGFCHGYRCAQAGTAGTHDRHVRLEPVHASTPAQSAQHRRSAAEGVDLRQAGSQCLIAGCLRLRELSRRAAEAALVTGVARRGRSCSSLPYSPTCFRCSTRP